MMGSVAPVGGLVVQVKGYVWMRRRRRLVAAGEGGGGGGIIS